MHWTETRDVSLFDRFASLYELAMPPAAGHKLDAGLAFGDGHVDRVLDVGGGTGRAARELDGATVVDAAAGMLREARSKGVGGIQGDAGRLPVRDASVDAVTIVDALHHFPDAPAAIAEAARVLRPGGVLVVREFDPSTVRGQALVGLEHAVGFDSTFYTPDDLADHMREAGLVVFYPEEGFGYTLAGVKRGD
ncbi:class I SAM-dependent methyltransferase [Halorarius litoreus]|uniref:class I SAM-dependent methyltransferase n=1 Tax=Halorarius litoreus TaxID=2962676 RepID=UPI0020CD280A|nr:methyltransferase domain-containing protein [Halorarius litoreus]